MLRVLLIAPYYSRPTPGESWSTYKWVEGVSAHCETTILTTHVSLWDPNSSPTQAVRTVNFKDVLLPKPLRRFGWELKPTYILFYKRVRRWMADALSRGEHFDIVHQINPLALRYPCPAAGFPWPFLMGPLAGSVPTPAAFAKECNDGMWLRRLCALDNLRLRKDPLLRRTYSTAATVIGVAPYVQGILSPLNLKRFEVMSETGVESLGSASKTYCSGRPLRLLYVGRIIRSKGLIDGIRAIARLPNPHLVRLDVVGAGELMEACQQTVARHNLEAIVTFHGKLPRDKVTTFYNNSDAFLFPSFREPSGNVVFEALGSGLPVITSTSGGPGYLVTESCGIKVPATDPDTYATELAKAILHLIENRAILPMMSKSAMSRIAEIAVWPRKIELLTDLYTQLAAPKGTTSVRAASGLVDHHGL